MTSRKRMGVLFIAWQYPLNFSNLPIYNYSFKFGVEYPITIEHNEFMMSEM